ncbi:hypothetical protein [Altererythrobacter lauratis]|uniref:Flagellar hook-length control protein FliK n=1 Tax=Alteraurantiacibacter lauratis TaxID=2054627 RepID=A0ABV7EEU4_9SPHN
MNLASLLTATAGHSAGFSAPQVVNAGADGGETLSSRAFAELLGPLLQGAATPDARSLGGKEAAEGGKDLPVAAGIAAPDAGALAVLPELPEPLLPAPEVLAAAIALPDAAPNADVPVAAERGGPNLPVPPQVVSRKPAIAQEMPGASALPVPPAALAASGAPAMSAAPLALPFARTAIHLNLRGEPGSASAAQLPAANAPAASMPAASVTPAEVAEKLAPEYMPARGSAVQAIAARLAERAAPSAAIPVDSGMQEVLSPLTASMAMPVRSTARGAPVDAVASDKPAAAPTNAPLLTAPASAPAPAPSIAVADAPRGATAESANTPQAAATPTTPGHDFEAVIDRLAQARELAQPGRASLQIAHREFGQVAVQFDMVGQSLKVALSSSDAGFAPAVQAALADRPVIAVQDGAAARNDARGDGRNDARADQGGGQNPGSGLSAQSDQQRGEQQARAPRNLAAGEQILRQNDPNQSGEASPRAPRDGSRFA